MSEERRLSYEEFVKRSIETLRSPKYKGIHSVYSGFNQAFKEYFGEDPIKITKQLADEGKIAIRPAKGGVMIYLPEDVAPSVNVSQIFEKMGISKDDPAKLTYEEFVRLAIERLRPPKYKGIHSVYSGFNQAFKEYFGEDPIKITKQLADEGKITVRPAKGGVMIYLPEDVTPTNSAIEILKKMGLK
jgi:predicted membrane protein